MSHTTARFFALAALLAAAVALSGCAPTIAAPTITPTIIATQVTSRIPALISHPMPDLNIDREIYVDVCHQVSGCPAEGTELASLGCDELLPADPWLGGLWPSYPIARCGLSREAISRGLTGLYTSGCESPVSIGYVILRDGEFQLITSVSELRALYAPIESEEEAWSYALAGTGLGAYYFDEVPSNSDFFVEQLEDTHVTRKENGYSVNLYQLRVCGCGYHETYAIDVLVTVDGDIKRTAEVVVYQGNSASCVD